MCIFSAELVFLSGNNPLAYTCHNFPSYVISHSVIIFLIS